jgi:hypothetical protein
MDSGRGESSFDWFRKCDDLLELVDKQNDWPTASKCSRQADGFFSHPNGKRSVLLSDERPERRGHRRNGVSPEGDSSDADSRAEGSIQNEGKHTRATKGRFSCSRISNDDDSLVAAQAFDDVQRL